MKNKYFMFLLALLMCISIFPPNLIHADDKAINIPEKVTAANVVDAIEKNTDIIDKIRNDYFESTAFSGEEATKIIVPFAKTITVCEPCINVLQFSYYKKEYTGKYNFMVPFMADDKFRGFISFKKSENGLQYNEICLLSQQEIDFIKKSGEVYLFSSDILTSGYTKNLYFISKKDNKALNLNYKPEVDFSETNSLLDFNSIKPIKTIDCSSYSNNKFQFQSGKKYEISNEEYFLNSDGTNFSVQKNPENLRDKIQIIINEKSNGCIELSSAINPNCKLSADGINEFKMVFQKNTLNKYKFVSTDSLGQEKYLTYDSATGKLYLTQNKTDQNSYWQINKYILEYISAGEPCQEKSLKIN